MHKSEANIVTTSQRGDTIHKKGGDKYIRVRKVACLVGKKALAMHLQLDMLCWKRVVYAMVGVVPQDPCLSFKGN